MDAKQGKSLTKDPVAHKERKLSVAKDEFSAQHSGADRMKRHGVEASASQRDKHMHKTEQFQSLSSRNSTRQKADGDHFKSREKHIATNCERNVNNTMSRFRDAQRPKSSDSQQASEDAGTAIANRSRMISSTMIHRAPQAASTSMRASMRTSTRSLRRSISESDLRQENGGSMPTFRTNRPAENTKVLGKSESRNGLRETIKRHTQAALKSQGADIKQLRQYSRLKGTPVSSKETTAQRETARPAKLPAARAPLPNTRSQRLPTEGDASSSCHEARSGPQQGQVHAHPRLVPSSIHKLPSSKLGNLKLGAGPPDRAARTSAVNLDPKKNAAKAIALPRPSQIDELSLFANGGVNLVSMRSTTTEDYRTILDLPDPYP